MKKLYIKKQLDLRFAKDIPDFEFKEFKRHEKLLLQACKDIKNMNAVTAQNIKNYILIRLVTIFENEVKVIISYVIDNFSIKPSQILGTSKHEINLDYDVENIKKENLTTGKIIASLTGLAHATKLDIVLSNINKVEFFEWAQDIFRSSDNIYDKLDKIFKERNNVAHRLIDVKYNQKEFEEEVQGMLNFIPRIYIMTYINLKLAQKNLDSKTEKLLASLCRKHLLLPLSKFKKITKSHKTKNG